MNIKHKLIILVIVIFIVIRGFHYFQSPEKKIVQLEENGNENKLSDDSDKVKISVYYEALCPDSKFFVTYQLLPVYEDLMNHIEIDLVPYGKAQTKEVGGKLMFHCQHDEIECFANKIHACAIKYEKDPLLQVRYVACMITDNMIPEDAGEKCGRELNIDFTPISKCANDEEGSQLLAAFGKRTHSLSPSVRFIPTIELNESQNLVPQSAILKDLLKSICQVFKNKPTKCE